MSETKFHTHTKPQAKIIVLCVPSFMFLNRRHEDKRFWTEWQQTLPEITKKKETRGAAGIKCPTNI
jgi:hypothetical protein